jgi:Cu(I)/Ag(I) efflux system membrane fusion protein
MLLFLAGRNVLLNRGSPQGQSVVQKVYYCPMHTSFTSDKPGNCIICGMKLVKKEGVFQLPLVQQGKVKLKVQASEEKNLPEVCIEHNCTMNNCTMNIKTHIKPGERIICPVCGEFIATTNGKVVEVAIDHEQHPLSVTKERKLLYYRNPMNPEVTSPVPMKDSMGMDYVPVYEEAQGVSASSGVMISPEKQQLIGVKTEAVTKRHLTKVIRAYGKIAYDPELYIAQEEHLQALKMVNATKNSVLASVTEQSGALLKASEKKLLLLGMSKNEIEQLSQQGLAQENLYLPGEQNSVWAYIAVYEYEIGLVKVDALVEAESVAYPGEVFSGKVVSINPVLDPASRTNQVRVELQNPEGKLKPEMFVNAKIQVDLGEKLAVPESAVLDTGIRKIVYLSKEGDILESREVTLGQKAEGYYEVLEGLSEGDIVVTSGNFLVDSESKLKGAAQGSEQTHGEQSLTCVLKCSTPFRKYA